MSELRIRAYERIEMAELHDDAALVRHIELAEAIDPRREVGGVIVRKRELTPGGGMEIRGALPRRRVERVDAVAELLKSGDVVREQIGFVVQADGAALKELCV